MSTLYARLHAYAPFGASLGILPQPTSFDASSIHNDNGALTVSYSLHALGGDILKRSLESGMEIAVEVSDGNGYREPANMRYLITGRSGDSTDESDTIKLTGPSIGWLLSKILNNDSSHLIADGDNKGKRAFLSANAGTIIRTMLDENMARGGAATGLTWDFDTSKDSGGSTWSSVYTLYYSLGTSLQSMLSSMVGGAAVDWRVNGRRLSVYNADSSKLSRDLSDLIRLRLTRDVGDAPNDESISDLASDILVAGDNGLLFRQSNPAAPTPWGKWESYQSQGGVSDKSTAQAFMQATLESSARVRGQYTRTVLVNDSDNLPMVDYRPGDWVTAPTVSHGERTRVQQVTISLDSEGKLSSSVILNDIRYDASVRQSKKISGITGGAVLAGSEGGRPSPENDHRQPSAPAGLVVATAAYIDNSGYARGTAEAQWQAVATATDNSALDVSGYQVQWRVNTAGSPWRSAGSTTTTSLGFGPLDCGVEIVVRVRATPTYSDTPGAWSGEIVTTVAADVTPPSVPSAPVTSSDLGVVKLHWDGLTYNGGRMELDFDHLEIGCGSGANNLTVIAASQTGSGDYLATGLSVGSTYVFALRAVDHSGNVSAWSATAQATVDSAVRPADLKALDDDIASNTSAITTANQQIAANKTAITTAQNQLSTAQSDITKAKSDITSNASAISQARTDITSNAAKAQSALDKANTVGTTVDGLHNVFTGPSDPTTLSDAHVRIGDTWRRTQPYWTTWQGAEDASPSMLADFYTYWQGAEDSSPSVLVTLDSRIVDVSVWDGLRWNALDLIARNVLATGTITGDLIAGNTIRGNSIITGSITTGQLAALSVTTDKITALAVTVDKLAANSVSADKLAANAVTAAKIAALSIDASKIVAGSITGDRLAANTITAREIKAQSITSDLVAAGQFTGYVFTGAVFQSNSAASTGLKISGAAIDLYNSSHVNTIHLDGSSNLLTGRVRTGLSGNIVDIDPAFDLKGSGGFTSSGSGIRFTDFNFTGGSAPFVAAELQDGSGKSVSGIDLSSGWRDSGTGSATLTLLQTPGTSGVAQLTAWRDAADSTSKHAMLYLSAPNSGSALARLYSPDEVNITATKLTPNAKTALTGSSQLVTAMSQSGQTINWTTATLLTELGFVVGVTGAQSHSVTLPTVDQYNSLVARMSTIEDDYGTLGGQVTDINTQLGNNPSPTAKGMTWTGTILTSPPSVADSGWSAYYLYESCIDASTHQYARVLSNSGKLRVALSFPTASHTNVAYMAVNVSIDLTESPRKAGNPTNVAVAGTTHKMVTIGNDANNGTLYDYTWIAKSVDVALTANKVYYVAISYQTYSPGGANQTMQVPPPTITVTPI